MITGRKFVLVKPFEGFPRAENVEIVEEVVPPLKDGEYLCRTVFQSVDPYQRVFPMEIGETIVGYQVAMIIDSKTPKFPIGKYIIGYYGWKTHHIYNETSISGLNLHPLLLPDEYEDISVQDFIGVMGIPGLSAYVGLFKICQPRPGETIVISAAAGAVGNLVGQMAKIQGCTVLGVVGSDHKGQWIKNVLGFDGYINYKEGNLPTELKELAPNGVDMYFDNVGGEISSQIIKQMTMFGRIAVCGGISTYNDVEDSKASTIQADIVRNSLKMIGFRIPDYEDEFLDIMKIIAPSVREGKLKAMATITKGFERTFQAFCAMLRGENIGKAIVQL
ncbi:hypothetical protein WA026_017513 [Henosepilachna vigintioctopunctata]|uniref:15-oxoprostaglandin 13-reductase n=1 Tax=Henosepilachna vigintioctopunctata TaxID=420089 RepID=A0AAW1V0A5_9CUCU